jgi:hypothetical protein
MEVCRLRQLNVILRGHVFTGQSASNLLNADVSPSVELSADAVLSLIISVVELFVHSK